MEQYNLALRISTLFPDVPFLTSISLLESWIINFHTSLELEMVFVSAREVGEVEHVYAHIACERANYLPSIEFLFQRDYLQ